MIPTFNAHIQTISDPTYDSKGSWQATSNDIQNIASHTSQQTQTSHIDTSSYSTQHYAFLAGQDNGGALGIAYLGTTCLRLGGGTLICSLTTLFTLSNDFWTSCGVYC